MPRNGIEAISIVALLVCGCRTATAVKEDRVIHPMLEQRPVPSGLGVNIHFFRGNENDLKMIAESGIGIIRMDWSWGSMEKKPGEYDFRDRDELVARMESLGIRILFIIDYGNPNYDDGLAPHTEECRRAYAAMCGKMAERYKDKDIIWELWNEPNIGFWKPQPNVDDYVAWVKAVVPAIRQADPGACIIGPATSTLPMSFMEACFKQGYLELVDGVSVHPYRRQPPETALKDYRSLRRLIRRYAPSGKGIPIISGEWGYSCTWIPADLQGKYLPRQWLANASAGVPISIWYDWHDDGRDPKEKEHNFGTVTHDYRPKPAYVAMKSLIWQLKGLQFQHRLVLDDEDDFLLLFADEESAKLVAWTIGEAHSVEVPTVFRATAAVDHLGRAVAVPGGGTLMLTDAPVYIELESVPDAMLLDGGLSLECSECEAETGTGEVRLELDLKNPLGEPVEIEAARLKTDGAQGRWVGRKGKLSVAPGRIESLVWQGRLTRMDLAAVPFALELSALGTREGSERWLLRRFGTFVNPEPVRCAFALSGRRMCLVLEHGEGYSFAGKVSYEVDGKQMPPVPIRIYPACASTRVMLPGAELGGEVCTISARVLDDAGNVVFEPAGGRYRIEEVFDSTKAVSRFAARLDGDANVPASVQMQVVKAPGENPPFERALRLDYEFAEGWRFFRLCPVEVVQAGRPRRLLLWIYGDGGGDKIRCRLVDSSGQTFQPTAGVVSEPGWRLMEMAVDESAGHWGGPADGVMRPPFKWDSVFLLDSAGKRAHCGTIYIAGIISCHQEP